MSEAKTMIWWFDIVFWCLQRQFKGHQHPTFSDVQIPLHVCHCKHICILYIHVCIYIYMYLCKYIYIFTCEYMYIYICIYVYMYMCICIYVYVYVYVYICICMYIYIYYMLYIYTIYIYVLYIYMYLYIYIYLYMYLYIYTSIYLYVYRYVYIYICQVLSCKLCFWLCPVHFRLVILLIPNLYEPNHWCDLPIIFQHPKFSPWKIGSKAYWKGVNWF